MSYDFMMGKPVTPVSDGQLSQIRKMAAEKDVSLAMLQRGLDDSGPNGFSAFLDGLGPIDVLGAAIDISASSLDREDVELAGDVWHCDCPSWADFLVAEFAVNGLFIGGRKVLLFRTRKQKAYKKESISVIKDNLKGRDLLGGSVPKLFLEYDSSVLPGEWSEERPRIQNILFLGTKYQVVGDPEIHYAAFSLEKHELFLWKESTELKSNTAVAILEDY